MEPPACLFTPFAPHDEMIAAIFEGISLDRVWPQASAIPSALDFNAEIVGEATRC